VEAGICFANRNHRENKVYGSLSTGGSRAVRETGEMVAAGWRERGERLHRGGGERWNVAATDCKAAMRQGHAYADRPHVPFWRTRAGSSIDQARQRTRDQEGDQSSSSPEDRAA